MSVKLRQFMLDAYETRPSVPLHARSSKSIPIQIDDQDDLDRINEFCNIFCSVRNNNRFTVELIGHFPITREMADLVEIYNGLADTLNGRLVIELKLEQIGVILDLTDKIRKTSFMGSVINNPNWLHISARTISSLYRFVRIIKEYSSTTGKKESSLSPDLKSKNHSKIRTPELQNLK